MKASELSDHLDKKKKVTLSDLINNIRNRSDPNNPSFCWFLGAGASCSSGILTAQQLVTGWRQEIYSRSHPNAADVSLKEDEAKQWFNANHAGWYSEDYEYGSFFEKMYPLQRARRMFIESQVSGKLPSIGYAYLVRLAEHRFLRTIFTTNFDDLINEAFYQFSATRPLVCAHDSSIEGMPITSARPKIVKLHGDYLFDDIKATEAETVRLQDNIKNKFQEFLKEYGLIIVGYSGGDQSIISPLEAMIGDNAALQSGVFWCFRPTDTISSRTLSLLKRNRVFYVLIDGFDEMLAETYVTLLGKTPPFTSKIAADRAATVIESYINNHLLADTKCEVIKAHLDELKAERQSSRITEALNALSGDANDREGLRLRDSDFLALLEIEQCARSRDVDGALTKVRQFIHDCSNVKFRKLLLMKLYRFSELLNLRADALTAVEESLQLEPQNFYITITKCGLLQSRKERIALLKAALSINRYNYILQNSLAHEMSSLKSDDPKSGCTSDDIEEVCLASIAARPSISNPAYMMLYRHLEHTHPKSADAKNRRTEIIETHLGQNPYSYYTTGALFTHCKLLEVASYRDRPVLEYLVEAFQKHYPKKYVPHLRVIADACLEFGDVSIARDIIRVCDQEEECVEDEDYVTLKMMLRLDGFCDLNGAVRMGEAFLATDKSVVIERQLFELQTLAGEGEKQQALIESLRGAVSFRSLTRMEARALISQGRYQDAIDRMHRLPDDVDEMEGDIATKSFCQLKMGNFNAAFSTCADFLKPRAFNPEFQEIILNYEFAKVKAKGGKPDRGRLEKILERPSSRDTKAVALFLRNEKSDRVDAMKIFQKEAERRFSRLLTYITWPILEPVRDELIELKQQLLDGRRVWGT